MSADLMSAAKMAHDCTADCLEGEFDVMKHIKAVEAHSKAIGLHLQTAAEAMKNSSVVDKADPKTDIGMKPQDREGADEARAKGAVVGTALPGVHITAAMALSENADARAKAYPFKRK